MMTCKAIQEELAAYRDGELPEQDREQIAAHLKTCAACTQEEAQLAKVEQLLAKMERITPSADFAAKFWERLEQEKAQVVMADTLTRPARESRLVQWWREFRETWGAWQIAPALAAAASVLVFFGYLFTTGLAPQKPTPPKPVATAAPAETPAGLVEKVGLFVNYKVIADLERLSRFEEIAAVELPGEQAIEIAKEEEIPPEVLQNPSFFSHYPILQKLDQLKSLEAVLDNPTGSDEQNQG